MLKELVNDNIIDTTDSKTIENYKRNLDYLINKAKEEQKITKFALIRNDDFFPYDRKWLVNSSQTNGEYRTLARVSQKEEQKPQKKGILKIFNKSKEKNNNPVKIETLKIYSPVQFRSTKHFTVNTALGMTSEYNLVEQNRKFTIIDDIDNFINSDYGYSFSARDAYLDVTHEPLKISSHAIIVISIDTYNEIKNDKDLMQELKNMKLVIYKGSLDLAINMILTEKGILPTRCEIDYDNELKNIIKQSFEKICINNNLEYNRPHGMTGHFTSYIDQYDKSEDDNIKEFISFINNKLKTNIIKEHYVKNINWTNYINIIGIDIFKELLNEFNSMQMKKISKMRKEYIEDRKKITKEISQLFKDTIKLIRNNEEKISFIFCDSEISKIVISFYLSRTVEEQVMYAKKIQSYFKNYYNGKNSIK